MCDLKIAKRDAEIFVNNFITNASQSINIAVKSINKIYNITAKILTVSLFLIIGTNIYSAPPYSGGGQGTQGAPYIILTMQDWNDFIDDIYIAGLFQGGNDYFQLGADIGSAAPNDRVPNKR